MGGSAVIHSRFPAVRFCSQKSAGLSAYESICPHVYAHSFHRKLGITRKEWRAATAKGRSPVLYQRGPGSAALAVQALATQSYQHSFTSTALPAQCPE